MIQVVNSNIHGCLLLDELLNSPFTASTFPHPLTNIGEEKLVLSSLSMSMNTRF